jgi:cell wall-associated NlpC family hydrolase
MDNPSTSPNPQQTRPSRPDIIWIARSWIGTPFHPHAAIRGAGVDCVRLVAEILAEAGLIQPVRFPNYSMDGGHHLTRSQVEDWLDSSPDFARLDGAAPCTADVHLYRLGRVGHHVGMITRPPLMINALPNRGVIESRIDDPTFSKRFVAAYRLLRAPL